MLKFYVISPIYNLFFFENQNYDQLFIKIDSSMKTCPHLTFSSFIHAFYLYSAILLLQFSFIHAENYSYKRTTYCVLETQIGCVYWQSKLNFKKKLDASCFPQQTYLQGRQDKIKISQLKVGDQILVLSQGKTTFQPVIAWLHRQQQQTFEYNLVKFSINNQNYSRKQEKQEGLYISGMHNIALLQKESNLINYQFAQNLKIGDILYGNGPYTNSLTPTVTFLDDKNIKKGIYAPYTSSGNYFISGSYDSQQLILVHCFAHVSPKYHWIFDWLIKMYPSWNIQPQQPSYIHPLSSYLKGLFPSVIEIKTLNNMAQKLNHNSFRNFYDQSEDYEFRANTHGTERSNFDYQRKIMVIIDKVFSMVQHIE